MSTQHEQLARAVARVTRHAQSNIRSTVCNQEAWAVVQALDEGKGTLYNTQLFKDDYVGRDIVIADYALYGNTYRLASTDHKALWVMVGEELVKPESIDKDRKIEMEL